jgi:hypothetical protein
VQALHGRGGREVIWIIIEEIANKADVIGGLVLSVLTYFAGVSRGKKYRQEDLDAQAAREAGEAGRDADRRINEVVQRYVDLFQNNRTGALHGLLVAGIKSLRSSQEIRMARDQATAQTGRDPLRQYSVEDADLKEFIGVATFDRLSVTNDRELHERFDRK